MSGYRVDPAVLDAVDASLAECARHARAQLRSLQAVAQELLGEWDGAGAVAFRAGWDDWHAGVTELLGALADLARVLGVSGHGYAATEDAVRTSMVSA